jgi:hypothetical protein
MTLFRLRVAGARACACFCNQRCTVVSDEHTCGLVAACPGASHAVAHQHWMRTADMCLRRNRAPQHAPACADTAARSPSAAAAQEPADTTTLAPAAAAQQTRQRRASAFSCHVGPVLCGGAACAGHRQRMAPRTSITTRPQPSDLTSFCASAAHLVVAKAAGGGGGAGWVCRAPAQPGAGAHSSVWPRGLMAWLPQWPPHCCQRLANAARTGLLTPQVGCKQLRGAVCGALLEPPLARV